MGKNNVKLNYIYNLMFQIFSMITPLITTPYVSRVLSPVGIGQYSFSASINTYFCLLAALGFSFYAQREVAKTQGDSKKQSVIFWEIVICKIGLGFLVFIISWILIFSGQFGEYTVLIKIMSLEIIGTALNISFFFQGNENFGLIVLRDFIIRVTGIVFIFVFVKQQSDLWLYAFCNSATALISAISLWFCLRKKIRRIKLNELNPLRHLIPSIKLFIPTIAISIYTILDKTLIGILIPGTVEIQGVDGLIVSERLADIENGMYAQSEKIIKICMTVIASLGTVMMPRNAKELSNGNEDNFRRNINKAIEFVLFIGAPMWAGITAISFNLSPWFFGDGYDKVPYLLWVFAIMIIPAGLGNVLGQQYLIPKGEDSKYAIVYVACAVLNFVLNVLLIPSFLSLGAAVASVIAEMLAPAIMLCFARKNVHIADIVKNNWKPVLSSVVMFCVVFFTSKFLNPSISNTILLILEGVLIYIIMVLLFHCNIAKEVLNAVKNKCLNKK
ncbi:MAG: flippase [Oscillospiraceae bacterium]|nr:flippase [Oscillospiraceae bacterium]